MYHVVWYILLGSLVLKSKTKYLLFLNDNNQLK